MKRYWPAIVIPAMFPSVALADEGEGGTLSTIAQYLLDAFKAAAEWLLCWIVELVKPALEGVVDLLPTDWLPDMTGFVWWVEVANYWLPVDWAVNMILIYLSIETTYMLFSWFVKLVPWK